MSPNRGFVSLRVDPPCGIREDRSRLCAYEVGKPQCVIQVDGRLRCWGKSGSDGPTPDPEEFPFGEQRFVAVSDGSFVCAIRVDRTLACTAYGYEFPSWVVPGGEFVAVSAGRPHMCGVRVGGALACWRHPYYDDPSAVLSPPAGRFTSVSVGSWFACGVRSGGRVECWGDYDDEEDNSGQSPPAGWFESVAVAGFFSCGLRVDGEVECWGLRRDPEHRWPGWNADGGLWPQGPFTALGVGSYLDAICALRVGGEFVCWNDGSATHRAPQGAFVALDAGLVATCGLRPGGEAVCWGFDEGWERQHTVARPLDWDIPAGPFTAISVGDRYACALRPGGEAACWGHGKSRKSRGGVAERETLAEREIRRRLQPPPGPFVAISAGYNYTCGLRPGGEAACWGLAGTYSERELADPPPGPFVAISAGERRADDHACGLRPDDTAVCWDTHTGEQTTLDGSYASLTGGHGYQGYACGLRPDGRFACADADNPLAADAPHKTFRSVAATLRGAHACGLDFGGELTCWGVGSWHEPAPPGPFTAVTVGRDHSCGLRADGTAECWTPHWPPGADPVYPAATPAAPAPG